MRYTKEQKAAITEVLREYISVASPKESILVDHCLEADDSKNARNMLSFDGGTAVHLVLPLAVKFLKELGSPLVGDLGKKFGQRLTEWLLDGQKRNEQLDARHLWQLGEDFKRKLSEEGMPQHEASRITNTLVATLVAHPGLLRKIVRVPT